MDFGTFENMVSIGFGPYTFGFDIDSVTLRNLFEDRFRKHLAKDEPDLFFHVTLDDSPLTALLNSLNPIDLNKIDGNRFCFVDEIIQGEFLNERNCSISLKKQAFDYHHFCLFDVFLIGSFYYLERLNEPNELSHFIVHASAVSRKGRGFIFPGPPESGKTTVASLLDTGKVLHDEAVLISLQNMSIQSTPLLGKFPEYQNGKENLSNLFFLKQDTKAEVKEVSKFEAYNRLFRQLVIPLTLLDNDKRKGFEYIDRFCFDFVTSIPYYELSFPRNNHFWSVIEDV